MLQYIELLKMDLFNNNTARLYILIVAILMMVNWSIEAMKWKYLTSLIFSQSLLLAGRAVLSGLAVSIFTPNRSGDFAGRIMHLPYGTRLEGAFFSFVGSIAQLLITVTTGGIALFYLEDDLFKLSKPSLILAVLIVSLIILILHYLFFNMRNYLHRLEQINYLKRFSAIFNDSSKLTPLFIFKLYGLSLIRYAVFSIQFFILLRAFNLQLPFPVMMSLVMISFLFITAIPSFAISEIGIRGSICIFFFSKFTMEETGVLMASTALWLINIAMPAVIGAFGILYFKRIR